MWDKIPECEQIADHPFGMNAPEMKNAILQKLEGLGCSVEQKSPFLVDQKNLPVYQNFQFLTKTLKNLDYGPKLGYFP